MRPQEICLCSHIVPIQTQTKFVILIHPMEFKKVKNNTGRITHLSLPNSEFIMGLNFDNDKRVNELIKNTNAYVLYPGSESLTASNIANDKENTIFIIDATWPCSRKMMKSSPNLQHLPKISFTHSQPSIYEFKRQPNKKYLSTIESTHRLLKELSTSSKESIDNESIDSFLNPFKQLIKIQIDYEANPNLDGYRRKNNTVQK